MWNSFIILIETVTHHSTEFRRIQNMDKQLDYQAIIVGAGFGGMGAAIELKKLGIERILILDRMDDLGGTWHINQYPGIAVDIPSPTYSYSFEPNPKWSRMYAPGNELKSYALHVANKYKLKHLMRFQREVSHSQYNEQGKYWTLRCKDKTTEREETFTTQFLILATGFLSQPKNPEIPGLESFAGKTIHTAAWDHDYQLAGKKVAVIGTGATSVQLLPEIAPQVEQLNVYQRTAIWVAPKVDRKISKRQQAAFEKFPFIQRALRMVTSSVLEVGMVLAALYNKQFPFIARNAEAMCTYHLNRQIKDKELRKKLTPTYSFGCKRPTFSNHYFRTFTRNNVELVIDKILRIEKEGIVSLNNNGTEQLRKIDTLILATGFKMWEKGNFPAFEVYGKNGRELGAHWLENGYECYDGISVEGFPNFFNLASPYAFTGLSYFFSIEGQMKHINRCITAMRKANAESFEVDKKAQERFVVDMKQRLQNTIFSNANCSTSNSYYFNGRGEANLLRPTTTMAALWRADHFPVQDYHFN